MNHDNDMMEQFLAPPEFSLFERSELVKIIKAQRRAKRLLAYFLFSFMVVSLLELGVILKLLTK